MSEDNELALQVVEMRDKGISWNAIGLDLGLVPDAGNEENYKRRAAAARRLYKQAKGGLPPSTRAARAPREAGENGETPKRSRSSGGGTKRVEFAPQGEAQEKLMAMTDEELVDFLKGRTIQWTTIMGKNGQFLELNDDHTDAEYYPNECQVGRKTLRVVYLPKGRAITFNEAEAGSRSIYLHRIHTVK
jgi:hypothetical protein